MLYKLIGEFFAPAVLYSEELILGIMRKLYASPPGDHLAKGKLLEKKVLLVENSL